MLINTNNTQSLSSKSSFCCSSYDYSRVLLTADRAAHTTRRKKKPEGHTNSTTRAPTQRRQPSSRGPITSAPYSRPTQRRRCACPHFPHVTGQQRQHQRQQHSNNLFLVFSRLSLTRFHFYGRARSRTSTKPCGVRWCVAPCLLSAWWGLALRDAAHSRVDALCV